MKATAAADTALRRGERLTAAETTAAADTALRSGGGAWGRSGATLPPMFI
jgi:hypothetical protein